jgi:hypothetical protein
MRILIENFGGMVPILEDRLLPPNMAAFAANADLESGALMPITLPELIHTFGTTVQRAVRIPDPDDPVTPIWKGFESRNARFFPGPLVNDSFRRHIWIDENAPGDPQRLVQSSIAGLRDGDPPYLLGVPAPDSAPTVGVTGGTVPTGSRAYVFTLVNLFGEEGQPSPPTTFSGNIDGTWNITDLALPAGVDATDRGIVSFRLYRTVTGSTGTAFYRVADVDIDTFIYDDTRTDTEVATDGLFLDSILWREPEEMEGFIELPGGFFAGWNGRTVFFSEPYRPWAWPAEYILSTSYDIIAAGVSGSSLILFTTSRPVVIAGTRPEIMQIIESDAAEPCFFPNSVVSASDGIYFAGRTGLFLATQNNLSNLTRGIIKQADWQEEYQLANLSLARLNDTQVIVLSTEGFGFILDLSNDRTGLIRIENLATVDAVWNDPYTGEVHAMFENKVFRWQSPGAPNAVTLWRSKEYHLPKPVNFGAMIVYVSNDAAEIPLQEYESSIITVPLPVQEGGPWLDQAAVYNYTQFNTTYFNQAPEPGDLPPGVMTGDGWPYWFGFRSADNNPDIDIDLPTGEMARIEVWANNVLISNQFVRANRQMRLPAGFKADRWRFVFVTRVPVMRFVIAETGKELAET